MIEAKAKVAKGIAALYVANITALLLNTLFLVLLANSSTPETVGLFSFLNLVLVAAATLAVLALPLVGSGVVATPPAVTRFLGMGRESGSGGSRRVYLMSLAVCTAVSASIVVIAAYSPLAASVAGASEAGVVILACIDGLVYSFAQLGAYTLLGTDRATAASTLVIISSVLRYAFATIFLLDGQGLAGVFIGFVLGDLALAVLANLISFRALGNGRGGGVGLLRVVRYMVSVFFSALMGLAVSQADKLITFFQLGLGNLAVYNIATVGAAVASFAPAAATNILVPALGTFGDDEAKKLDMLRAYTRHISLSAIPIGFLLAALSPFLLLIFGDQYRQGAPVMVIIAISISFTAIASVYSSSLLVEDKAHHFTLSNLAGLAGLVLVAAIAVGYLKMGYVGIALGRAAMLFISLGAVAYFARKGGRLVLDVWAYLKSLFASGLMALFVFAVLFYFQEAHLGRLSLVLGSIVMIPVGFAYYLLVMKLLKAYNEEDMDFIDSLLPRSLRRISRLARRLL